MTYDPFLCDECYGHEQGHTHYPWCPTLAPPQPKGPSDD
jgi:hypothetical protein